MTHARRVELRGDAPRPRLLVVEDDALVRDMLADALDEGHDVLCAATGAGALSLLAAERVDALVVDWRLPDGAPGPVLREAERLGVPALVITGDPGALTASARRGRPVLAKPFGPCELRDAVARLLGASAPAAA